MEYINFATKTIGYIINAVLLYAICLAQLKLKKDKKKIVLSGLWILVVVLEFWLIKNMFLHAIAVLGTTLLFEVIMLEGEFKMKLLPPCVFGMVHGMANLMNIYTMSFFFDVDVASFGDQSSIKQSIIIISGKFFLIPLMAIAIHIVKKHSDEQKEWIKSSLLFLANYFICILVVDVSLKYGVSKVNDVIAFVILFGVLIFNIINSVCIIKLNEHYNYKIQSDILKTRFESDKDLLNKMEMLYENSRIIRHDMKHYLSVVYGLIEEGNNEEAKDFINDILGKPIFAPVIYYMGSKLVNATLNNKQRECELKKIKFNMMISGNVPKDKDMEVAVILCNLLDNAIEAQETLDKKEISLEMHEHKGMYYIITKNKIDESVLDKNTELDMTTKKDDSNHGIGMRSVKKMVSDMDGSVQWYEEDGYLIIYISVPFNID